MLIDALKEKSAEQLIHLIEMSEGVERLHAICIHLTAIDTLMRRFPVQYQEWEYKVSLVNC